MNVGLMQFVNKATTSTSSVTSSKNNVSSLKNEGNNPKFGDVFSKIISADKNSTEFENVSDVDVESLQKLADSNSLDEIFDLLNISYDGSLIMLDNDIKSIDDLMNLDDLLSIVGIDFTELQNIVSKLLGTELSSSSNVWDLIEQINENAPQLIAQLQLSLSGDHSITPKQSQQFLTFLKLAQVVGEQSDLVLDQPLQLIQLKEFVETVVQEVTISKTIDGNSGQVQIQNFQQVVEKVMNSEESKQQSTETTSKENSQIGVQSNQNVTTRTVTIQLPANKASQAEELVNRIEKLLSQSQISKNQGILRLQLKLYPENLGSIRIELVQRDGVLSARLLASSTIGKEMLDSQLHQLKNAFVQQNIQLDRIDVQQAIQEKDLRDQNLFNNFFNQQNQNDEDKEQEQEDDKEQETQSFQDFLLNVEV